MKIIPFKLGSLQANCYFLIKESTCLIIDPADEAPFILEELQRRKLTLIGLLATHGHFDHIMAAGEIQKSFSVPFYIVEEDLFLVKRLNETAEYFLGFNPHSLPPEKIKYLGKGNFQISNFEFRIFPTPGHTPGSACFYLPAKGKAEEDLIFTGDTLFKGSIGRYDFSYSSKKDLKKSLVNLLKLPSKVVIYPGHGEKTTISSEKRILDFYPL